MTRLNIASAYVREWLIYGISLLAFIGWFGISGYQGYVDAGTDETERLTMQASVVSDMLVQQFKSINNTLTLLREEAIPLDQAHLQELNERLRSFEMAMPAVRTILVTDTAGIVRASNRKALIDRDVRHRAYFQAPLNQPDPDTLYVSPPFVTELDAWTVNLTRMIPGPRGEFAGVITASLDTDALKVLLSSVRYAPNIWASLTHDTGTLYMREPYLKDVIGLNLNVPDSFFSRHIESGQNKSVLRGSLYGTGEECLAVLRNLPAAQLKMDHTFVIAVSHGLPAMYRDWKSHQIIHGAFLIGLAAIGAFALTLSHRRRRGAEEARRWAEQHVNEAKEQMENFFSVAPDLLCIADLNGQFRKLNPSWETILGYPIAELENTRFLDYVHPDDREATISAMSVLSKGETVTSFTNRYRHRNGSYRYIEWRTVPQGNLLFAAARDVSERMRTEEAIRHLAFYDELTGLPNRALLLERLEQELAHARRDKTMLALLFVDLDKFKPVNDIHGHQVGDELLRLVAQRMELSIRESDTAARLAGDEFVVLIPNLTHPADAESIAGKIREALEQPFFTATGLQLDISCSIGVALYPQHAHNAQDLLMLGDEAMYMAKDAGRNTVKFFHR